MASHSPSPQSEQIPLLSPKAFRDFAPAEFQDYVRSLYVAPPVPEPLPEFAVRLNKKGNAVITVRREPKFLTSDEIGLLAAEAGMNLQSMWAEVRKRKIEIRVPELRKKRK